MVLCMPCSPRYTAVQISKITPVIKVATMRKYDGTVHPSYRLKLKYPLPFPVSYFQLITSSTNQELFEKQAPLQSK